jgi:F-type H+-transporting ATPase subunit beta
VPLEATLKDCDRFLQGGFDDIPEDRCYMRGTMAASGG